MDRFTLLKIYATCLIMYVLGVTSGSGYVNVMSFRPTQCNVSNCDVCCNCNSGTCGGDCKEGYHGGKCYNKCPGNCTTCKDHSDTKDKPGVANCTKCKDGFYVTDTLYQCQLPCPPSCKLCSSDTKCSSCKYGYYGYTCDRSCSIGCPEKRCNKESGECQPCEANFNGSRCGACDSGKYGNDCSFDCPQNCIDSKCDQNNGDCFNCQENFDGQKCETCISGKHGSDCSQNCPENCLDKNCNNITGECFSCIGNFDGPSCIACADGKYGENCDKICPNSCNETRCHQLSVNCWEYKCDQIGGSCAFCKQSLYGIFCNKTCPEHCSNDTCDQHNGTCTDGCDDNFIGDGCDICLLGAYGENCNLTCPDSCYNGTCRRTDGTCFSCKDNFNGTRCEECSLGMHGLYCNESCPGTCYGDKCDRLNMTCTDGCIGNFTGDYCSECQSGLFGQNCSVDCPANCEIKTCDKVTGNCSACVGNYSGPICEECISGLSGYLCDKACPSNCFQGVCDRLNGTCSSCVGGFDGVICDDCKYGRFGEACNQTCPEQCNERSCDRANGTCTHGCNENFVGDVCDMCKHGKYGEGCSLNCFKNCLNGNCTMDYGICDDCVGNFTGDKCDECVAGLYGDQCSDICPDDCVNKTCDKETGHCKDCSSSKHGPSCELLCSSTCVSRSCHMVTAHCLLGCSPGYVGDLCDERETSPWITVVIVVSSITVLLFVLLVVCFIQRKKRRLSRSRNYEKGETTHLVTNGTRHNISPSTQRASGNHDYENVVLNQESERHEPAAIDELPAEDAQQEAATSNDSSDFQDQPEVVDLNELPIKSSYIQDDNFQLDVRAASDLPKRNTEILDDNDQLDVAEAPELPRKNTIYLDDKDYVAKELASELPKLRKNITVIERRDQSAVAAQELPERRKNSKYQQDAAIEAVQRLSNLKKERPFVPRRSVNNRQSVKSQMIEMRESRKSVRSKLVTDNQLRVFSQLYSNQTEVQIKNGIIPLDHLAEYVATKDDGFYQEEYLKFPKGLLKPCEEATLPHNLSKNRYNGIYPYDETRVRLRGPGSDFINACYVNGYAKHRQYIAALGPIKRATDNFETFWRMIWQEKVDKIVMVTNLVENGSMKCEQYWPNEDTVTVYGGVKVTGRREQKYAEFVIRTFLVESHKECRLLLHFHFTSWPDKAAPEEVTSIIEFRHIVNSTHIPDPGPVVIHCSAGIGRTGTYIALEFLTEQGLQENCVDVFGCIRELRQQRTGMVQKWEQFKYIHQALVHSLLLDSDAVAAEDFLEHAADKELVPHTFQKLALLSESVEDDEREAIERNIDFTHLNREGADIPGDRHRVRLYLGRAINDSDYINAVYLDSFTTKNKYILAQTPLRETVQDFLTLVVQERCPCIVTFGDLQPNQNVGIYVPRDNKGRLGLSTALEVSCTDVMQTETYVKKTLMITCHTDAGNKTHEVSHIRFNGWPPSSLTPRSAADFVQLVQDVEETAEDNGGPVLVHCLTGAERSGLFCVVSTLLERLDSVGDVSVVNAVKKVQFRRPAALASQDQFEFCHETVCEFLKTPMVDNDSDNDSSSSSSSSSSSRGSSIKNADSNVEDLEDNADHVYGNVKF